VPEPKTQRERAGSLCFLRKRPMKAQEIESELWEFLGVTKNEDVVPDVMGRYRVDYKLGSWGMGTVFKAYDIEKKRDVALKIIKSVADTAAQEKLVRRFHREALIMRRLLHRRIVYVFAAYRHKKTWLYSSVGNGDVIGQWSEVAVRQNPRHWSPVRGRTSCYTREKCDP
jgi:serine/threonine protein kinase